ARRHGDHRVPLPAALWPRPALRRRAMSTIRAVQWRHPLLALVAALVVFYLVFPLLVTIPVSFNPVRRIEFPPRGYSLTWYRNFLGIGAENRNSRWLPAAWLSIRIALATSVLSTVLGGLAAIPI